MQFSYFIGCDISKYQLDFAVLQGKQLLFHKEISNDEKSVKNFIKELLKLPEFKIQEAIFCMEHTGIYNNHLLACLFKKKAKVCLQAATHIKNSLGNIRGKNDKIDAIRIAEYAYKNREELHLWEPKREIIQDLSNLSSARARLIKTQIQLNRPLQEDKEFISKKTHKKVNAICSKTMKAIKEDLAKVDKEIDRVIASDQELKRLFGLVTSVSGIGIVTATQIVITTNEFKSINNPKQFACYAGIAPFTNESGMFKGKARVSHMANKKVKTLLHMSAMTAIIYNEELKTFYRRKVDQEKKNKMSVINAIRNKLVLRIFACVNQNRKYEKNYARPVA